MQLIHCADWHLDSGLTTNMNADQAASCRIHLLNAYIEMVTYAINHRADAIIIAGDLFDSCHVRSVTLQAVRKSITDHPNLLFFYLSGNHDEFRIFDEGMKPDNLILFSEEFSEYRVGGITFSGICLNGRSLHDVCDEMIFDEEMTNVLILHGSVSEYHSGTGKECIALSLLKNRGVDYLALGHWHTFREEKVDRRMMYCYPGCPEGRGFDETGEKGFAFVTISPEKEPGSRVNVSFVPFSRRRFEMVTLDVSSCLDEEDILKQTEQKVLSVPNLYGLKLILTGQREQSWMIDPLYLSGRLKEICDIVRVEDRTTVNRDDESAIDRISLESEFRRIVLSENLSEEDREQVLRIGLEALKGV